MAYSKQTWDTTSYVNPTRMNHIEQGIYDVEQEVGSLLRTKRISHSYSVNANSEAYWNPYNDDITLSGYTPIGIIGFATNNAYVHALNLEFANNNYAIGVHNFSNNQVSTGFAYDLLYVKDIQ